MANRWFGRCISVLLIAGLAGCGEPAELQMPHATKKVGVYVLAPQSVEITTDLPGRTVAFRLAEVRPQVEGIIEKRLFNEGANVTEGQVLYQIDADKYQAAYDKALANLSNAEQQRKRYRELVKTGSVSKQQFDDVEASWKLASAEAELARIDLNYTQVLAPVTGRIGRSAVSEGALVTERETLLATIQQIDPIYVDITQPVSQMLSLRDAMDSGMLLRTDENAAKVQLNLDNGKLYSHEGSLRFSEVSVDQGTGSVTLRAIFPNPDWHLLPGMFVRARLAHGRTDGALLVPQQAVQRDVTGKPAVWVVKDDKTIEMRRVTTANTIGNMWLVIDGLNGGEQVVTEGVFGLRTGMAVEAIPASNVNPVLSFDQTSS